MLYQYLCSTCWTHMRLPKIRIALKFHVWIIIFPTSSTVILPFCVSSPAKMLYDGRRLESDGRKGTSTPSAPPKIRHSLSVTQTREKRYLFWLGTAGATRKHASQPQTIPRKGNRFMCHVGSKVWASPSSPHSESVASSTTKGTKVRAPMF